MDNNKTAGDKLEKMHDDLFDNILASMIIIAIFATVVICAIK